MADSDGRYQRECWVWFPPPDLRNHNMALDQYEGHWMIRADGYPGCGHLGQARVRWPGADEPPAGVVRAALVSAGLLPAEHLSRQERAIGAVRKLHKGRINEDYPQEKPMCAECGEWSPCPTEQAIAKALAGEEGTDGS